MIRRWGTAILLVGVIGPSGAVAACGNGSSHGFDAPGATDAATTEASDGGGNLFGNDAPGESLVISPQNAMITATCGLGLLDTSAVAESFGVAHSVSKLIRSLAGSPESDQEIAFGN